MQQDLSGMILTLLLCRCLTLPEVIDLLLWSNLKPFHFYPYISYFFPCCSHFVFCVQESLNWSFKDQWVVLGKCFLAFIELSRNHVVLIVHAVMHKWVSLYLGRNVYKQFHRRGLHTALCTLEQHNVINQFARGSWHVWQPCESLA